MNILSVLKPVLYLGFLVGLAPYSIHKERLYFPASVYSLTLILLVWQSYTKTLSMIFKEIVTDLYAYGYLLPLQMSLNSLVSVTSWIIVLYRHEMWLETFRSIVKVVTLCNVYESNTSYTETFVIQTVGMLCLVGFTCLYYVMFYFKIMKISWVIVCGQSISTAVNILLLVEFLTYITVLKKCFCVINNKLNNVLNNNSIKESNNIFVDSYDGSELSPLMFNVREAHGHLCRLCKHINYSFSCQLLATIGKAILLITIILYTVSLTFLGKADSSSQPLWMYLSVMCSVLVQNTVELLVLVVVCSSVADQANNTAVLVHKLLTKDLTRDTRDELQLFSCQLLHQKVYFSVCGFFNLDFTLLNGVIASVATYLVILIQFQM